MGRSHVGEDDAVRSISPHSHAFPALDGLRGVAVGLVLLVHIAVPMQLAIDSGPTQDVWTALGPLVSMGGSGVHLFFVLSGFLLFLPFARALVDGTTRPRTGQFYRRRLRRIIPAYYVALVFSYVVYDHDRTDNPVLQFATHLLLVHNYSRSTEGGLNEPTWTMATEAQFYALLPLIAALAIWLMARGRKAFAVGALALLSASAATTVATVALTRVWPGFAEYDTSLSALRYLTTFGFGIAVAYLYALARAGSLSSRTQRRLSSVGLLVFVSIFGALMLRYALDIDAGALDYYGYATIMGLCFAGLLAHVVFSPQSPVARMLSLPAPRFLGDISYSVYLLHRPVLLAWLIPLAARTDGWWPLVIVIGGSFLIIVPLATASFWFIERPFLRPATRSFRPTEEPSAR